MMQARLRAIRERASRALEQKVFPGCVIGIVYTGGERFIMPFGTLTFENDAGRVREDTIYDLASVTKSIPTTSLALHYLESGQLKLTDKLIKYVPEFKNSDRSAVKIKHLLTYTLGGYPLSQYKDKTPQELYEILMTRDFDVRPGTGFSYSNLPAFLLGLVVERVGGRTLDKLAYELFFNPLHMIHTSFFPQYFLSDDIAPTEVDDERGEVRGMVHDESAYVFTVKGGKAVGHAGLFSTAPDLLNFLEMLLHEGDFRGHQYFLPDTIDQMSSNQIPELNASTGLGWQTGEWGRHSGLHTFGKTGFTGTCVVCDVEKGAAFTILSNRTYPKRPLNNEAIKAFRDDIADIVLSDPAS